MMSAMLTQILNRSRKVLFAVPQEPKAEVAGAAQKAAQCPGHMTVIERETVLPGPFCAIAANGAFPALFREQSFKGAVRRAVLVFENGVNATHWVFLFPSKSARLANFASPVELRACFVKIGCRLDLAAMFAALEVRVERSWFKIALPRFNDAARLAISIKAICFLSILREFGSRFIRAASVTVLHAIWCQRRDGAIADGGIGRNPVFLLPFAEFAIRSQSPLTPLIKFARGFRFAARGASFFGIFHSQRISFSGCLSRSF